MAPAPSLKYGIANIAACTAAAFVPLGFSTEEGLAVRAWGGTAWMATRETRTAGREGRRGRGVSARVRVEGGGGGCVFGGSAQFVVCARI